MDALSGLCCGCVILPGDGVFFISLNDTRNFIGEKGVEYCWMYGSFERYLYINLASIGVSIGELLSLYWLAQRNYLFTYLILWAAWRTIAVVIVLLVGGRSERWRIEAFLTATP